MFKTGDRVVRSPEFIDQYWWQGQVKASGKSKDSVFVVKRCDRETLYLEGLTGGGETHKFQRVVVQINLEDWM